MRMHSIYEVRVHLMHYLHDLFRPMQFFIQYIQRLEAMASAAQTLMQSNLSHLQAFLFEVMFTACTGSTSASWRNSRLRTLTSVNSILTTQAIDIQGHPNPPVLGGRLALSCIFNSLGTTDLVDPCRFQLPSTQEKLDEGMPCFEIRQNQHPALSAKTPHHTHYLPQIAIVPRKSGEQNGDYPWPDSSHPFNAI